MSHARKGGLSVEQRVYRHLQKHGPSRPMVVAAAFGVGPRPIQKACLRLLNKGTVTATGMTNARVYTAVPGKMVDDQRGMAPASQQALQENSLAVRNPHRKPRVPKRITRITLEQHWGNK